MAEKDTYDFEAKRIYRERLKRVILTFWPKQKQRATLKALFLPGHEAGTSQGSELEQVYDSLGFRRENLTGIERRRAIFKDLRGRNLGINLVRADAGRYIEATDRKYDIINLDLQGHMLDRISRTIMILSRKSMLGEKGVLGTNFLAAREGEEAQLAIKTGYSTPAMERVMNYTFNKANKMTEEQVLNDPEIKKLLEAQKGMYDEQLGMQRSDAITTGLVKLMMKGDQEVVEPIFQPILLMPEFRDAVIGLARQVQSVIRDDPNYAKELGEIKCVEDILKKPFILRTVNSHLMGKITDIMRGLGTLMAQEGVSYSEKKMGKAILSLPRAFSAYLISAKRKPYYPAEIERFSYTGDNGSTMFTDFIYFKKRPDLFQIKMPELIFDARKGNFDLGGDTSVKDFENFVRQVYEHSQATRLINDNNFPPRKSLNDERKTQTSVSVPVQPQYRQPEQKPEIKPDVRESIRADLQDGIPDEEIMKKYGIGKMQLAGHKATISKTNGTPREKNDRLYHPSTEENEAIKSCLERGVDDETIIWGYHLTQMQLAARKAWRTRGNGNGSPEYSLKLSILERDSYTCQMPGCGKPLEQQLEDSGHNPHVHHIDYNHDNNVPENMVTLCTSCHAKTNTIQHGPTMKPVLESVVREKYKQKSPDAAGN